MDKMGGRVSVLLSDDLGDFDVRFDGVVRECLEIWLGDGNEWGGVGELGMEGSDGVVDRVL